MTGPSDEELLRLLQEVEARVALAGRALEDDEDDAEPARERAGDPCPHCGELALAYESCSRCDGEGCLPRDDWMPGDADCCLTRCARCGLHVHLDCALPNIAGNLVCCGPVAIED